MFAADTPAPDVEPLYAAIGRLPMANALLKKRSPDEHDLAASTGAGPGPGPSTLFRHSPLPGPGSGAQQLLLPVQRKRTEYDAYGLLNEEFTRHNFKGVRGLTQQLRLAGYCVNEKRVRRLVRLMGHEPVYPRPRLTVPGQGTTPYPYPLRRRPATAPNEVWSTYIPYVPMAQGFLHLTAVLD